MKEDEPTKIELEGNVSTVTSGPLNVKLFCALALSLTSGFTFQSEEFEWSSCSNMTIKIKLNYKIS
jgi:hypothetical protein